MMMTFVLLSPNKTGRTAWELIEVRERAGLGREGFQLVGVVDFLDVGVVLFVLGTGVIVSFLTLAGSVFLVVAENVFCEFQFVFVAGKVFYTVFFPPPSVIESPLSLLLDIVSVASLVVVVVVVAMVVAF